MDKDRSYLHSLTAGALLPLCQSLIPGVMVGVILLVIGYSLRWQHPWVVSLVIGSITVLGTWLNLAGHWKASTRLGELPLVNQVNDIAVMQPREIIRVQIEELDNNGHIRNKTIYDLPASRDQLEALAHGVLQLGMSLSERNWAGAGKPFSIDRYRSLRLELERRGVIVLASGKDARLGYTMTRAGRAVFRQFIPSPIDGVSPLPECEG